MHLFYYNFRSSTHSAYSKNDYGASKHRHRAAPAQELLYASKSIDQQPPRIPLVRVPSLSSFLRYIYYVLEFNNNSYLVIAFIVRCIHNYYIFIYTINYFISGLIKVNHHL